MNYENNKKYEFQSQQIPNISDILGKMCQS